MISIACEASFWRPTGLGNRLFSWSRAKVFSKKTGSKMLAPNWAHLRGASIIRGGINYNNAIRKILLFDNFRTSFNEINGFNKFFFKKRTITVSIKTLPESLNVLRDTNYSTTISFVGNTQHIFDDLWEHRDLIKQELYNITKQKWVKYTESFNNPFIGINIRTGKDFKSASSEDFRNNTRDFLRTPLDWYIESLRKVRELLGEELPAIVISDGNRNQLMKLLNEPLVTLPNSKSAISDLMILSKAQILIGAGRSSFSAWASFLGKMPTVTIPGSNLQSFLVSSDLSTHYVGEFDPKNPPLDFIKAIKCHQ